MRRIVMGVAEASKAMPRQFIWGEPLFLFRVQLRWARRLGAVNGGAKLWSLQPKRTGSCTRRARN